MSTDQVADGDEILLEQFRSGPHLTSFRLVPTGSCRIMWCGALAMIAVFDPHTAAARARNSTGNDPCVFSPRMKSVGTVGSTYVGLCIGATEGAHQKLQSEVSGRVVGFACSRLLAYRGACH